MFLAIREVETLDEAYDMYIKGETVDETIDDDIYVLYTENKELDLWMSKLKDNYEYYTSHMSEIGTFIDSHPNEVYNVGQYTLEFSGFREKSRIQVKVDHKGIYTKTCLLETFQDLVDFTTSL